MRIRSKGVRLLKWLARTTLLLLVPIFVAVSVWTSVPLFGLNNSETGLPEIPPVHQATMDKAAASEAGQQLQREGFSPLHVIEDTDLIGFLDEQQKKVGINNPGPYTVFVLGQSTQASKPGTDVAPDVIVDATNGVMVGLRQEYANERGIACFNSKSITDLSSRWVVLNVHLWGKPMPLFAPVSHKELPQLPESAGTIPCYLYPTS